MKSLNVFPALLLLCFVFTAALLRGQSPTSYLNDIGSTAYGVNIPVENGFINVSNGNLHLEFPMSSHPQRGALSLSEKLTYDSRIWNFSPFGTKGSYHWWPYNVPGASTTSGGWQFVTGGEVGTLSYAVSWQRSDPCDVSDPGGGGKSPIVLDPIGDDPTGPTPYTGPYVRSTSSSVTWTDPAGSAHAFNASVNSVTNECDPSQNTYSVGGGFATDGSGFQIPFDPNGSIRIIDASGTQVYPNVADRYGNEWLFDSSGNLIDDTGLTPVIATQNGLTTYYDVLAPNGPINNNGARVRYTVTSASVNVSTQFIDWSQSDIHSWVSSNLLTPVQSIVLPDGSKYSFTYDINGELATMTLATGGVIKYGYTDFVDSGNTENNWLTSRQVGSGPAHTFKPSVGTSCANYSNGCVEYVIHHRPSGDETLYQLTLANGAWNTATGVYTGAAPPRPTSPPYVVPASNLLLGTNTTYQYSNACSGSNCVGANYVTSSLATTTLGANGVPSEFTQALSTFDPVTGKPLSMKEWDYSSNLSSLNYSMPPTSTPARDTEYTYTGLDPNTVTVFDSNGQQAGQTTYSYTTSATSVGPFPGWSSTNAGGPYLQSVSHWVNTSSNLSTTTYTMDSTGMVTSVVDANKNPASSIQYQCNNSLPYISTNALQQSTTYGYDCNSGALTSAKDPNGAVTTYTYEATAGRLSTATLADGGTTTYSYPSVIETDVSVSASPSPSIDSSTLYDTFGRTVASLSGGVETDSTYDSNGRPLCSSLPYSQGASSSGSSCVTSYDGLDRPLSLQQSDASTRTWSYSANTVSTTDEVGNTSARSSDAFGHLRSVVEPGPSGPLSTAYVYDGLGNIQTVTQSGLAGSDTPRTRTFTYDSMSRLVCEAHPESSQNACPQNATASMPSQAVLYAYDLGGRLQTKTDARGVVTSYSYDALNRVTFKRYSDGTTTEAYGYDGLTEYGLPLANFGLISANSIGRLSLSARAGLLGRTFSYDLLGRVTLQNDYLPSVQAWGTLTAANYDLAGNMISLTYPDGRTVSQSYDGAGHVSRVGDGTHTQAYLQFMTYYPNGSPSQLALGNGIVQNWSQNNRLQVSGLSVADGITGATYLSHTYCYVNCPSGGTANNGNLWQIADNLNSSRTQAFTYDNLNRISSFSLGGVLTQQYAIDSFGNLSGMANGQPTQTFDPATNRISNLPCAKSIQPYDAAGNQLCDTDQNGAVSHYSFDAQNRVAQVNTLGNAVSPYVSFLYGADGSRARKSLNANGTFTEYLKFNGQTIAEKDQTGAWTDYVFAGSKRIAKVQAAQSAIHMHGVRDASSNPSCGTIWYAGGQAASINGYQIQQGDQFSFDLKQSTLNVLTALIFTDGTVAIGRGPIDGQWHHATIDLSGSVGKVVSVVVLGPGDPWQGQGIWDAYEQNVVLTSADGSIHPLFTGGATTGTTPNGCGSHDLNFEVVSNNPVQNVVVRFNNDSCSACSGQAPFQDRNLFVNSITVGNQTISSQNATYAGVYYLSPGGVYGNGDLTFQLPPGSGGQISVSAYGTPDIGVYPHMEVLVNGTIEGEFDVSGSTQTYTVLTSAFDAGASTHFYLADHLGSAQMEFSASGAPLALSQFMPFGGEINPPLIADQYKFTGLERDDELQQDHAQFRQLAHLQGRWTSADPYNGSMDFGDPQSLNRYAYASNNPLRFVDPWGLTIYDPTAGGSVTVTADPDPPVDTDSGYLSLFVGPDPENGGGGGGGGGAAAAPAPSNAENPPPCQAKILSATNNQFGTNYTDANVSSRFNYSTGAGPGQGTLNLNITGSTAGVSPGYYPVHWYSYIIGYGPTLHVVSGPGGNGGLDSQMTVPFGPNQGTFHIDSAFPHNPFGAIIHGIMNMTKLAGYPKC